MILMKMPGQDPYSIVLPFSMKRGKVVKTTEIRISLDAGSAGIKNAFQS